MKKAEVIEIPIVNIERNVVFVIGYILLSVLLIFVTYLNIISKEAFDVNPAAFFLIVPTLLFLFQALWILLNPYILIFEDRFEIKKNLLSNKVFYLVDFDKFSLTKNNSLKLIYNDGDVEVIKLTGIRETHKQKLLEVLSDMVVKSKLVRTSF